MTNICKEEDRNRIWCRCNTNCGNYHWQHRHFDCWDYHNKSTRLPFINGKLLLGDIKLSKSKSDEFFSYFDKLFSSILVFQVSHHGATNGWDSDFLHLLPKYNLNCISYGIKNRYRHPNRTVLLELINNNKNICLANEENDIIITTDTHIDNNN